MAIVNKPSIFPASLFSSGSGRWCSLSLTSRVTTGRAVFLATILVLWMVYFTESWRMVVPASTDDYVSQPLPPPVNTPPGRLSSPPVFELEDWYPPAGTKVVALVFYGRREYVSILDCYLKRNLKANGGILDEVIFTVKSTDKADLEYIDDLVKYPGYRKYVATKEYEGFSGSWECVNEPDTIYVKVDDDVVYIEDTAFKAVAKRLIENPQIFAASANVINNPALAWVHYHLGVYEPFWPEMQKPHSTGGRTSWKPSSLPPYKGPASGPAGFDRDGNTPAPYKGHRWLPVPYSKEAPFDISLTPATSLTYDAWGPSLKNWAATAQTHYSFLTHLERGDTWRYHFDYWDYMYERVSINFIAVRGQDIIDVFPIPRGDDEFYLTIGRPKEIGKHVVVDGMGIVAHFSFGPQAHAHDNRGITWTDVLDRYRGYAEETGCPAVWDHLKYKDEAEDENRDADGTNKEAKPEKPEEKKPEEIKEEVKEESKDKGANDSASKEKGPGEIPRHE